MKTGCCKQFQSISYKGVFKEGVQGVQTPPPEIFRFFF